MVLPVIALSMMAAGVLMLAINTMRDANRPVAEWVERCMPRPSAVPWAAYFHCTDDIFEQALEKYLAANQQLAVDSISPEMRSFLGSTTVGFHVLFRRK